MDKIIYDEIEHAEYVMKTLRVYKKKRRARVIFELFKAMGVSSVSVALTLGYLQMISPFLTISSTLFFGLLLGGVYRDYGKWERRCT